MRRYGVTIMFNAVPVDNVMDVWCGGNEVLQQFLLKGPHSKATDALQP
jgi:hypothetical protein